MRIETELILRSLDGELDKKPGLKAEWRAWKRLFSKKYRDRTLIGVLIMVFQRAFFLSKPL